jgi:peptidoglycan/xylan/chitin deacetylase (PgdA/CDA1 family)
VRFTFLLAVMLGLFLAGCSGDDGVSPTPKPTDTHVPATATIEASATAAPATDLPATPVPSETPGVEARVITRGNTERQSVALTFDAGSDAGYTAQILSTLRDERVRATFGVTGAWAEANPDLLNAIAADGHQIINHTYDHASFTGRSSETAPLTRDERALELSRTETTVFRLSSRSTRPYFRPPYGDYDGSVVRDAADFGYPYIVMWTIDSRGWNGATRDEIIETVTSRAEPGAIVVMHVGSASQDAAALDEVIARLRGAGYEFETVAEIIE